MKLVQVGRDKWTVFVVANDDWTSDLLWELEGGTETHLGARMLSLLREYVPSQGAPKNEQISKSLGSGRFEFRRQPNKGPALRVLYFFDEGRVIVCSHAFWKKTDKAPRAELDRLDATMARYAAAKRQRKLEFRVWKPGGQR